MKRVLYLAMILMALASTLGVALAQPPGPHSITGKIARTGGTPAPNSALVWASVDDYNSPKETVKDGVYFVTVGPTDGKYIGRPISFWVDEDGTGPLPAVQATPPQAIAFISWGLTQDFDLIYTPPPPPTPTPLPPTPTPTPTPPTGATPVPTLPPAGTYDFFYLALGVMGLGLASLLLGTWAWRRGRARV
ncbi:MAG: hypothetical protein HY676_00770 [Chloroflexi bacterium]|nr:hypothetical protein [Chloroflexota bacterium]